MSIVVSPSQVPNTPNPIDTKPQVAETINNSQVSAPETVAPEAAATEPKAETELPIHVAQAIARKEKALRQRQRELESQASSLKDLQSRLEAAESWKERLSNDTLGVLHEAGIDYDQLTQAILNQNNPQDVQLQKIQREISALKKQQEEAALRAQENQTYQYEQAKKQIRREVDSLIDYDTSYQALKTAGMQDAVVDLIEQTYNDSNYIMNVEDAAKEILEAVYEDAVKLYEIPAVKQRLKINLPVAETPTQAQNMKQQSVPNQAPRSHAANTLSNRMVVSTASTNKLTAAERRERAMRAFRGEPI